MAQRFLTDIDVKGNISVTGDVTSSKIETTNLTLGDVVVNLPEGATGSVTVATSADVSTINQSLQTKQETIVVAEGSGLTKAEDGKTFGIDTTVIATAQSVSDVSDVATAAKEAAEANAEAIEAAAERIGSLEAGATSHYEVTVTGDQNPIDVINAAIPEGKTAIKGDTAVAKKVIAGDKMSYTAYVFNGSNWAAMDGNYNASNVYLDSAIGLAGSYTAIGNITKSSTTAVVDAKDSKIQAGMTIQKVFEEIFSQDTQPEVVTQPSVGSAKFYRNGTAFTADTNVEVGTKVVFSTDSASLSAGAYTAFAGQVATGVTAKSWTSTLKKGSNAIETLPKEGTSTSSSFEHKPVEVKDPETGEVIGYEGVTLDDGDTYTITVTASYDKAPNAAKTALKKPSEVYVPAGSKSSTSKTIKAYRKSFYGVLTSTIEADTVVDSAFVRGLASSSTSGLAKNSTASVTTVANTTRCVVFAYPASLGACQEIVHAGTKYNVKDSFSLKTVSVNSASGSDAINYNVYYMNQASTPAVDTYTLKI